MSKVLLLATFNPANAAHNSHLWYAIELLRNQGYEVITPYLFDREIYQQFVSVRFPTFSTAEERAFLSNLKNRCETADLDNYKWRQDTWKGDGRLFDPYELGGVRYLIARAMECAKVVAAPGYQDDICMKYAYKALQTVPITGFCCAIHELVDYKWKEALGYKLNDEDLDSIEVPFILKKGEVYLDGEIYLPLMKIQANISENSIRRWVKQEKIRGIKVNGTSYVMKADVLEIEKTYPLHSAEAFS